MSPPNEVSFGLVTVPNTVISVMPDLLALPVTMSLPVVCDVPTGVISPARVPDVPAVMRQEPSIVKKLEPKSVVIRAPTPVPPLMVPSSPLIWMWIKPSGCPGLWAPHSLPPLVCPTQPWMMIKAKNVCKPVILPDPKSVGQAMRSPVLASRVPGPLVMANDNGPLGLNMCEDADAPVGAIAVIALIAASAKTTVMSRLRVMFLLDLVNWRRVGSAEEPSVRGVP